MEKNGENLRQLNLFNRGENSFSTNGYFAYGWSELKVILYICIKYMKLHRMHLFLLKISPEKVF